MTKIMFAWKATIDWEETILTNLLWVGDHSPLQQWPASPVELADGPSLSYGGAYADG